MDAGQFEVVLTSYDIWNSTFTSCTNRKIPAWYQLYLEELGHETGRWDVTFGTALRFLGAYDWVAKAEEKGECTT